MDRLVVQVIIVCVLAAIVRIVIAERQTLWVDELFSVAMATGHSLEHPAASADTTRGDFAEPANPVPAAAFRRYLEHERSPVGPGRVVRAVLRSDTSPPLYYLLLNGWTRLINTSDAAVRLFSVLFSVACIPIAASLARRLGGRNAVMPAAVLFAFAPQSVYFGTEVRMYALLLFEVLALTWLTLRIHQRGATVAWLVPWIVISVAGLLTHYFFAFVWTALCFWLVLHPHRAHRARVLAACAATGVLVLPWYLLLPSSIKAWRVTGGWLNERPADFNEAIALAKLLWSYVGATGSWGASPLRTDRFIFLVLCVVGLFGLWRGRGQLARPGWQMLWLSLAAAMIGLVLFDIWQHSYTRLHTRYALPGLAAAYLLIALVMAKLPATARVLSLVLLVALWLPGLQRIHATEERHNEPFAEVARTIDARRDPSDLVLVQSIPSGVLGVARYLDPRAVMSSWVSALHTRRVPEDADAMMQGRHRVFFVQIHDEGRSALERYLRAHEQLVSERRIGSARLLEFANDRDVASVKDVLLESRLARDLARHVALPAFGFLEDELGRERDAE